MCKIKGVVCNFFCKNTHAKIQQNITLIKTTIQFTQQNGEFFINMLNRFHITLNIIEKILSIIINMLVVMLSQLHACFYIQQCPLDAFDYIINHIYRERKKERKNCIIFLGGL